MELKSLFLPSSRPTVGDATLISPHDDRIKPPSQNSFSDTITHQLDYDDSWVYRGPAETMSDWSSDSSIPPDGPEEQYECGQSNFAGLIRNDGKARLSQFHCLEDDGDFTEVNSEIRLFKEQSAGDLRVSLSLSLPDHVCQHKLLTQLQPIRLGLSAVYLKIKDPDFSQTMTLSGFVVQRSKGTFVYTCAHFAMWPDNLIQFEQKVEKYAKGQNGMNQARQARRVTEGGGYLCPCQNLH